MLVDYDVTFCAYQYQCHACYGQNAVAAVMHMHIRLYVIQRKGCGIEQCVHIAPLSLLSSPYRMVRSSFLFESENWKKLFAIQTN